MVDWTKEQQDAIYVEGSDILVAAAAGSGKTAVLVERIIQKLIKQQNPVDIDTLLVVTFTNAAAQEMRNRVGIALEKALAENPGSNHLKKQLSLLQRAAISTFHSFCLDIVKQYAYLLDIDPGFRIATNQEVDMMKEEVMEELLEEWYGKEGAEQEAFFQLVDRFSSDRNDIAVEELILNLYHFAIQNPYPDQWLDSLGHHYAIPKDYTENDLDFLTILKRELGVQWQGIIEEINQALAITRENDGPYHYADALDKDMGNVQVGLAKIDYWVEFGTYIKDFKFSPLSRKKVDCNPAKKERVKKIHDKYKKGLEKVKKDLFTRDLEHHVADIQEMAPIIMQLVDLVKQFKTRFKQKKQEKSMVDFSDLEHYALEILQVDHSGGEVGPSAVAIQLQKQFTEILVDEYQDTNEVQETILNLIHNQSENGNMFMVGDVKQSIYRFRHAEPLLFVQKYKHFQEDNNPHKRIDLASNFRSREEILTGTNYIFRQILDEKLGEFNYDQNAELIYANKIYDSFDTQSMEPELLIIDREDDQTGDDNHDGIDLEKAQLEARAYAEKIKTWIVHDNGKPLQVFDKETASTRDVQYRDMVILLRSMGMAPTIMDEFKKQGIPVYAELSTGYFAAIEVKIMISFLKVIDNPSQDIPLASVLRSPIVGLNEEDLARVRLADSKANFYQAVQAFVKQQTGDTANKLNSFLHLLDQLRLSAKNGALSELIWEVYRETGYYDFVGGMPGGRQRQANLRALYDRARGYETTSFRGLFRFLRFIERMEERGEDLGAARALSEQEDVVRIMTIHKSKGLEFPVVIVGAMDKNFNLQDLNRSYLLHKDLGLAVKYIDPIKRITYPTLLYYALKKEKLRETLAEEMRVLYVALTRAREKLLMVASVGSFTKKMQQWEQALTYKEWILPEYFRIQTKTFLDWVAPALMRHQSSKTLHQEAGDYQIPPDIEFDPSKWVVTAEHYTHYTDLTEMSGNQVDELKENMDAWIPLSLSDLELAQDVDQRLSFQYPHHQAITARAKQTVTEIKRRQEIKDDYSGTQLLHTYQAPIVKRPKFMQKEKSISAAERGTAMHAVMQHIPLNKEHTVASVAAFVESLVIKEILTPDEAESIDIYAIQAFFKTSIGSLMLSKEQIYRETPFSLSLPVKDVYHDWNNEQEQVLVQGIIDCLIPYKDGWILVDYKTDKVQDDAGEHVKEKLKKRYETQLTLYCRAIEEIWHQPIYRSYLYFFDQQLIIAK